MHAIQRELNVIIADDDRMTRNVLRLLLRDNGCKVVGEAPDGEKAVELCMQHKPDIAFLDIHMPKLSGHEAAEKIRQDNPVVGMVMITSLPTLDSVQKALQVGATGFVVKPFNAVKVVEAIDNCMKHKRQ